MSGSEFHVHGAHEHEMEHASHSGGSSSLAVATAIGHRWRRVFLHGWLHAGECCTV